jgi:hypothetical protein
MSVHPGHLIEKDNMLSMPCNKQGIEAIEGFKPAFWSGLLFARPSGL